MVVVPVIFVCPNSICTSEIPEDMFQHLAGLDFRKQ